MGDQPIPTDYMTGIDIDTSFTEATWADQYVSSASYFLLAKLWHTGHLAWM
jgi:hypothetical protein